MFSFDLIKFLKRQKTFSWGTFGPPRESVRSPRYPVVFPQVTDCIGGVLDHLRAELKEVTEAPDREARRFEWIDIIMLAQDGYLRDGGTPMGLALDLGQKQRINEQRKWPDWRTQPAGVATHHLEELSKMPLEPSPVFFAPGILRHDFVGTGKRCDVCFAPREAEEHATGSRSQEVGDETPHGV
jgi:hypothetical protein